MRGPDKTHTVEGADDDDDAAAYTEVNRVNLAPQPGPGLGGEGLPPPLGDVGPGSDRWQCWRGRDSHNDRDKHISNNTRGAIFCLSLSSFSSLNCTYPPYCAFGTMWGYRGGSAYDIGIYIERGSYRGYTQHYPPPRQSRKFCLRKEKQRNNADHIRSKAQIGSMVIRRHTSVHSGKE